MSTRHECLHYNTKKLKKAAYAIRRIAASMRLPSAEVRGREKERENTERGLIANNQHVRGSHPGAFARIACTTEVISPSSDVTDHYLVQFAITHRHSYLRHSRKLLINSYITSLDFRRKHQIKKKKN